LGVLAAETGAAAYAQLDGTTLLGERGSANGFLINGLRTPGVGAGRLMPTRNDGWCALTLLRGEDREMLPALFGDADLAIDDDEAIAAAVLRHDCADLVARGRLLGLPIASADEVPPSPPTAVIAQGPHRRRAPGHRPLVVDLSAIWAGPLIGHLFWLAGAAVVRMESPVRPDFLRQVDPITFGLINQGKDSVLLDLASTAHGAEHRAALIALIVRADVVIESSRVRALRHLGIDADALVAQTPGLVWISVTGHGARGEPADWAGIGNDCGVSGGLSRALADETGQMGFVGDAIADPLTAITGAIAGWRAYRSGEACRIGLAMSAIVAEALAEERARDPVRLAGDLRGWGGANGAPFPTVPRRAMAAPCHTLGADTAKWFPDIAQC
jgi:hypothetical protein